MKFLCIEMFDMGKGVLFSKNAISIAVLTKLQSDS